MSFKTITFNENTLLIRFDDFKFDLVSFGHSGYMVGYQGDQMPSHQHGDLNNSVNGKAALAHCVKGLISINYYPNEDFEFTKNTTIEVAGPYGDSLAMIEITDGAGQPIPESKRRSVRLSLESTPTALMIETATKMGFKRGWKEAANVFSELNNVDWPSLVAAKKPSS